MQTVLSLIIDVVLCSVHFPGPFFPFSQKKKEPFGSSLSDFYLPNSGATASAAAFTPVVTAVEEMVAPVMACT